jgi:hypothetical protein
MIEQVIKERTLQDFKSFSHLVSKVEVVYTDVDGTLLGPSGSLWANPEGGFSILPAQAVVNCLKHGLDVTLVSGRKASQLFGDARLLGFKNYLAELGCEIIHNLGEKSYFSVEPLPWPGQTPAEAILNSGVIEELFKRYPRKVEFHTPWSENRRCTLVLRGYLDLGKVNDWLKEAGYEALEMIDNGIIERRGSLDEGLPEVHAYHLIPRGMTKGKGVRKDRELRNLSREKTIAIGDAPSDLSIADEVGAFFLVRNGLAENEALAQAILEKPNVWVTQKSMGLGFAEVIRALLGY